MAAIRQWNTKTTLYSRYKVHPFLSIELRNVASMHYANIVVHFICLLKARNKITENYFLINYTFEHNLCCALISHHRNQLLYSMIKVETWIRSAMFQSKSFLIQNHLMRHK